jgi:hypothetical protein
LAVMFLKGVLTVRQSMCLVFKNFPFLWQKVWSEVCCHCCQSLQDRQHSQSLYSFICKWFFSTARATVLTDVKYEKNKVNVIIYCLWEDLKRSKTKRKSCCRQKVWCECKFKIWENNVLFYKVMVTSRLHVKKEVTFLEVEEKIFYT